jgi:hypothetical protein
VQVAGAGGSGSRSGSIDAAGRVALGGAIRGARAQERQRRADEIGEGDEIDRWAIATVSGGS